MQNTSCTEDRIQHALERCLHGLSRTPGSSSSWTAGLCLNYWSLEELVNREAANHIILAEKILDRTRQAQEKCEYELLAPLALMFHFAVLSAPWIPLECDLLLKAFETFHIFLTWPAPYCDIYQELLSFISEEQKAPGISYQRLVRAEQGLLTKSSLPSILTVLLVNPAELPREFLSVAEHLSSTEQSAENKYISLIQHLYQASLGPSTQISAIGDTLKSKTLAELEAIFADLTEALEFSAGENNADKKRDWLKDRLQEIGRQAGLLGDGTVPISTDHFLPISLPVPKCYTYSWDQDNFDVLNNIILNEGCTRSTCLTPEYEVNEEDDEDEDDEELEEVEEEVNHEGHQRDSVFSNQSRCCVYWNIPSNFQEEMANTSLPRDIIDNSTKSFVSSLSSCVDSGYMEDSDDSSQEMSDKTEYREERVNRKFTQKICKFFKPKNNGPKAKLKAELGNSPTHSVMGSMSNLQQSLPLRRAGSLYTPQARRVPERSKRSKSLPQNALGAHIWEIQQNQMLALNRRPFLSCNEDSKASTLRVVVFGSDRISGKLARAYSNLRLKESNCPLLTRFFKLQLYYVPVKRNSPTSCTSLTSPSSPLKSPNPPGPTNLEDVIGDEESTNDISHYIGMLDPWYKRNIQGLMDLSTPVSCQTSTPENDSADTRKMPILADMVLYYCRFAKRSLLLQLYRAEITFDGGRKQTEVFIQSLELGHSAALRAIKASGPGCKRLGIDGDREAIPFTLQIVYSKSSVSGRSRWSDGEKVCTSVSLRKACNSYEELDSRMECLNLTVREVVKRQNSKTKKSFNQQISISQIKVDKAQIIAQNGGTFPLCLDQDERKILQRVIRCEVSPCYKPEIRDFRKIYLPHWSQTAQDQFCSLLCLPVATFSGGHL
ncbi:phosphoinositide 3-kinase regulatory subunit 5 isoform X1 [Rana temporaria]|uniref:phosphoinositide 3-kinase regulatory subunit 5 isoform X1 n=1 Tax=Rana temporaria TaxID=8407 RepID=UPI001AAD46F3|nr:phosphoinositide 3-kinase regulatory subunit 5 isoform X1 [Rana temporaria]